MTNEDLLYAIGEIRADWIMDAKQIGKRKSTVSVRRLAVVAVAAALLMALAGTAVAYFSGADWFKSYFGDKTDIPLTTQQEQYIEAQTVGIGQSATSGGVTVMLESAFSDGYTGFIKLRVTAPEGVSFQTLSGVNFESSLACETPEGNIGIRRMGWRIEEDGDGKDHTTVAVLQVEVARTADSDKKLTVGYPWTLQMEDLYAYSTEYPYDKYVIAECGFTFQFQFSEEEQALAELTLDITPFACPSTRLMGDSVDVQIETFTLRSMGAEMSYTFFQGDTPEAVDISPLTVYMHDGTMLLLYPSSGAVYNHLEPEKALGIMEFSSDVPVILEEAEYILFPNGEKIWVTP